MHVALKAVFVLSGAAALLFETLWFRLTRLAFGSSVTAAAIVLASFMAGLALGNAAILWRGHRAQRPIVAYALLELLIGTTGLTLVLWLPHLAGGLAPVLGSVPLESTTLEVLRLGLSFALLLVPATAMGATLPLLMMALSRSREDFGPALGSLYGWNTLGAVAGALAGEWILIEILGLRGTGMVAATCNGLAVAGALWVAGRRRRDQALPSPAPEPSTWTRAAPLAVAAALAGAILVGLEVVWFRFLQLFTIGSSRAFAAMLAVVLLGIALGGFLGSSWLRARPEAQRLSSLVALGAGLVTGITYASFDATLSALGTDYTGRLELMLAESLALMLPTCVASGVLFTLLGHALREEVGSASRAAGLLTVCNTLGAAGGSLVAGFVLLPRLGVEGSLFLASFAYLGVFLAALPAARAEGRLRTVLGLALLLFAAATVAFPFGEMKEVHIERVVRRFAGDGSRLVAAREGQAETLLYLRKDVLGEFLTCRLVTNGFSMSALGFLTERYMRLFVNWAVAVYPNPRHGLLISYGVGATASALATETAFRTIDVVDISGDVIELSDLCVRPHAAHPLRDPRVQVHIEDGRFFLLTTQRRFDLITAEPPPPGAAGIENLYSQEYFRLLHGRLVDGGIATYWLPVHALDRPGALSVIRAFCDVFDDCSLWNGGGLNWMLAGSRGEVEPVRELDFERQWRDPTRRTSLADIGLEEPEDLCGLFLGDAAFLAELSAEADPLVDDRPYRLATSDENGARRADSLRYFESIMDASAARARFETSPWIARVFPEGTRRRAGPAFDRIRLS
jgi:predicted membrane-bound spermidine synthase